MTTIFTLIGLTAVVIAVNSMPAARAQNPAPDQIPAKGPWTCTTQTDPTGCPHIPNQNQDLGLCIQITDVIREIKHGSDKCC